MTHAALTLHGAAGLAAAGALALATGSARAQSFQDGSLETGHGGAWAEFSSDGVRPLCDGSCTGGVTAARSGQWYARLGGSGAAPVQKWIEQLVLFPPPPPMPPGGDPGSLHFYLAATTERRDDLDKLELSIDGQVILRLTSADLAPFASGQYIDVRAPIGGFYSFPAKLRAVRLTSSTQGGGLATTFLADDFVIFPASGVPPPPPPPPPPPNPCPANCNGDLTPAGRPMLDIRDFSCFQNAFAVGDLAKADVGGFAGCASDFRLDITDFTCFQNLFAQGCP